jgi:catalase
VHDGLANTRALSVRFQLPDSKSTDVLANSIEGFPAQTPEEFLPFLRAQLPDRLPASLHPMRFPAFCTVTLPHAPSLNA